MISDLLTFLGIGSFFTLYGLIVNENIEKPKITYAVSKSKFENFTAVNNFDLLTTDEKLIVKKMIMNYRFKNLITQRFIFINIGNKFVYFKIPTNQNEEILSFRVY
jgi:hypothetical protein